MLDRQRTVADVVLDHSECAAVFQKHRIDYCCRGQLSIEAAAKDRGVDVDALLVALSRAIAERAGDEQLDPRTLSTSRLVAYIVTTHHGYLLSALPFVRALATKVSRVHGPHEPRLRELEGIVAELSDTLLPHLDEEERELFPVLLAASPVDPCVAPRLDAMAAEHLAVAALLERIRATTDDFAYPEWACSSYRTLFSELAHLDADVRAHVHLENHVLKPRFAHASGAT